MRHDRTLLLRRSVPLDGLRGIGVLTVLAYHAGVSWLSGAFLDMDMFFVASGYLITRILIKEHDRWGHIRLLRFWAGRARRLLPAMVAVVLFVAWYSVAIADPTERGGLRTDMLSALTFWSNWHFINGNESYFAGGSTVSPLLHTWSLSIEEQFYLAWPLLLTVWFIERRGSLRWLTPLLFLGAIAAAFYMASLYEPFSDPSSAYYNTFARSQGLLLGCAAAIWLHTRRRPDRSRVIYVGAMPLAPTSLSWLAGVIGLAGFAALPLIVSDSDAWVFNGGFLLSSALAFAVLWHLDDHPRSIVARWLSWTPIAEIGKRTYGLYIWHWPLFLVLSPERTNLHGFPLLLLRFAVVFAVAFAFDWWVERPVLAGELPRLHRGLGPAATAVGMALAATGALISTADAQPEVFGTKMPGYVTTVTGPMKDGQRRVAVFGDSVAFTLWRYFPQNAYPNLSVGSSTQLGCGIAQPQDLQVGSVALPKAPQCAGWPHRWRALIDKADPQVSVVLSGTAELFDRVIDGRVVTNGSAAYRQTMLTAYGSAVDTAGDHGRIPVLLVNIPCYGRHGVDVGAGLTQVQAAAESQVSAFQNDLAHQASLNQVLTQVAATHANVHLLDLRSAICARRSAPAVRMPIASTAR